MNKLIGLIATATLVGCTSTSTSPTAATGALLADANAQRLGIYSYSVDGDRASMFDQFGVEVGQLEVSTPDVSRRVIRFDLPDGTTDEVEAYRPRADGSFLAPISRVNVATTIVADAALAPFLAAHAMTFRLVADPVAPTGGVARSSIATTTSCTAYNSSTPDGCVRPGNPNVGCTNPSQLVAAIVYDYMSADDIYTWATGAICNSHRVAQCMSAFGGTSTYWSTNSYCAYSSEFGGYDVNCDLTYSQSSWTASCPPQTCSAPNYDAVPRVNTCIDPGSCTYSTGTVACTTYH